ncbi:uncharacterized protein METZ01_LOCUS201522 [marine metagenome]|uniref:Uncharacterized protein n=1 Tax=marine metagenome TaxID=408172 RepID=A0A382ED85_9ZZZZ
MELQLLQDNHTKADQFPLFIQARLMQKWIVALIDEALTATDSFQEKHKSFTKTFN